jgi:hypothetical protein
MTEDERFLRWLQELANDAGNEGDHAMAERMSGVAKELEDWEWLRAHHHDIDAPILVCYDADKHESLEAAIDAARKAGEGGV